MHQWNVKYMGKLKLFAVHTYGSISCTFLQKHINASQHVHFFFVLALDTTNLIWNVAVKLTTLVLSPTASHTAQCWRGVVVTAAGGTNGAEKDAVETTVTKKETHEGFSFSREMCELLQK